MAKEHPLSQDGPRVIYLAPICCEDDGRQWCEDNGNWECECEDANHLPVKYVRSDIVDDLIAQLKEIKGPHDGL